jgi:hypothetical protein
MCNNAQQTVRVTRASPRRPLSPRLGRASWQRLCYGKGGPTTGFAYMKRSIGDFDVNWTENGLFIEARRRDAPNHQYYFRISEDRRPHPVPSALYGDVSTGAPQEDEWRFINAALEAAEEFLRLEHDEGPPQ